MAKCFRNVKGAEKLHFLVSASVTGYIQQLKGITPDIVNNLGKHFLHFDSYRFEIINSNIKNKESHQVAINFFSEELLWHDTVNDYLLVSGVKQEIKNNAMLTEMIQMQPFLGIYSLKQVEYDYTIKSKNFPGR